VRSQCYSRVPITGINRNEVLGVLYAKDLIQLKLQPEMSQVSVATIMRKPFFFYSDSQLNTLFRKFKQHKIHMAIVKNRSEEIVGIVTLSDILESLFEDIFSEDPELQPLQRPGARSL
jgi:CBS domain containing-hemolysin-like protein